MKYMITWNERSQGSPMEYENAQKRILEVFSQWKAPDNFKIEMFVIRVGDWGGYMLLDCDDPLAVHKFCSMLPAFAETDTEPGSCGASHDPGCAREEEDQEAAGGGVGRTAVNVRSVSGSRS